jgi:protein-S-isoprenylcysteine O-methyltransferase Ste14
MSLLRIPFVLSAAFALHVSATPPNLPPQDDEKATTTGSESIWAKTLPWHPVVAKVRLFIPLILAMLISFLLQAFYCLWPFLEIAVIVANVTPSLPVSSKIISALVPSNQPALAASRLRITPTFLVGWLLAVSGGLIRLACYRVMGKMFTFELTIRKEHKLITSGPYSIVRHPGYTAVFMILWGYSICLMSAGSWVRECAGLSLDAVVAQVLIALWAFSITFIISVFVRRTKTEDEMLRNEFRHWDKWAAKVPYKLFPLVY